MGHRQNTIMLLSPAVTKALAERKLVGAQRKELTGDICGSITVHTLYLTKAEIKKDKSSTP